MAATDDKNTASEGSEESTEPQVKDSTESLAEQGFEEEELPPEFERFIATLPVTEDGEIEGLEPPAEEDDLQAAEKRLAFTLPSQFRNFLGFWNGGSVFDVCIYGVGTEDEFDIVEFNKRSQSEGFPKDFVAFASTVIGDIFCFQRDWEDESGETSPVFLYDGENGTAVEAASSFAVWLERLPSLEQDVIDDSQPQPMSVDEWEDFLDRERAKLRRLSKTPARDLFMPDPEAIRAELKNKIPVDPRHLKPKT